MKTGITLGAVIALSFAGVANAESHEAQYEVTVTNITKGVKFTPFIAAAHSAALSFFEIGESATDEIAQIAEGGNIAPMQTLLDGSAAVFGTASTGGLLMPGESVSFELTTPVYGVWWGKLSLAAMLLPTNDTFVSLNGVRLPRHGSVSYLADAYDAGSEPNDELCASVPGPTCGGEGYSPAVDGEGFVYPAPGTHGEGDLSVAQFGWSGPVAKVTITRLD
ncbi:MAG: hypothetical protein CMK83_04885 [Pseudomonadales bacterium]|jgi:hypothetical protein|uniref:spondin domain-containing protein n=1 Tax=unclassified Ketobacter TaxID=2639109 RepID=UPI000C35144A|nr:MULTISPECIES: spondin domain-containing protein [unclassified Ketobacter]MAQ23536.1 hypothetical protein [Pseudomonadales bacterium]MEC8813317.1 spondin domain-containing protein [Pseudomonadota bacterium]HAG94433.1 hypothetical protein [Gammaproteobacteria bacterium]MBI27380.1 hypothetical protein [Pseudomonadales bacterium]MCK5791284.1 spondin domain-containing protein [Ketobacter sp.]|tara:strand:+ start:3706 stop:4368 length:663 start_codon:yes stop_codon:yes gene_type:complete